MNRIHVATRKGLFTLERMGGAWRVGGVHFLGDKVTMVFHDRRDGSTLAALDHGHFGVKMQRSRDGQPFEEVPAPAYPEKPAGVVDDDPMTGQPLPWTLKLVWALESAGPDRPGQLWCGTIPGGLFHSKDGGDSWALVRSLWDHPSRKNWFGGGADLPGIHSIVVDPRTSDRVFVGVSCGGVWVTEDAGKTWECRATGMRAVYVPPERAHDPDIQDPHRLAPCRANPDRLWVQHHNGIFRSVDAARSWQEIEGVQPSTFGFAVVAHPTEPDTAWFVPATSDEKRIPGAGRVVVNRTRDGGKSFETLTRGLPQEHAYDLVYRHALDIDETGNSLAFGSTTGSLWVSEDQGDSWHHVSAHLPPIYAVRFA